MPFSGNYTGGNTGDPMSWLRPYGLFGQITPSQIYGDYMYPGMISGPYNFGGSRYQGLGGYQNIAGMGTPEGPAPSNWFNADMPNFNTGQTPQAMNPMNVVNAALPLVERQQEINFGKAAQRAGRAGALQGSPYHADIANIAKESSNQIGNMYFNTLNQAAQQQAQRQMQAAQAMQQQGQWFQEQPMNMINMLNQMGMQQYGLAQTAMDKQYQDWLRRMYGNRQFAGQILGGGSSAAEAYAKPEESGGGWGQWLPLIAGIIGYAMSDKNLKKNIVKVGKKNGINLYEFEFKTNPGVKHVGVIAQEVEKTHPYAVADIGGYKAVNYMLLPIWR